MLDFFLQLFHLIAQVTDLFLQSFPFVGGFRRSGLARYHFLVGKPTKYSEQILQHISGTPLARRVHFLHGVSDNHLHALYRAAEVFVYPSRYEGFGIPIIEAIHSHLPVVAATGSCLEEAGGPDCLYVSPDDEEALAAAVRQL